MNKLIFTLKDDFRDDIVLIANNQKDLEDYIRKNYRWLGVRFHEYEVLIVKGIGHHELIATLQWVKHI